MPQNKDQDTDRQTTTEERQKATPSPGGQRGSHRVLQPDPGGYPPQEAISLASVERHHKPYPEDPAATYAPQFRRAPLPVSGSATKLGNHKHENTDHKAQEAT